MFWTIIEPRRGKDRLHYYCLFVCLFLFVGSIELAGLPFSFFFLERVVVEEEEEKKRLRCLALCGVINSSAKWQLMEDVITLSFFRTDMVD